MLKDIEINISYPIAILIVITEFKSVSENVLTITGVDIWEKIKELILKKSWIISRQMIFLGHHAY